MRPVADAVSFGTDKIGQTFSLSEKIGTRLIGIGVTQFQNLDTLKNFRTLKFQFADINELKVT